MLADNNTVHDVTIQCHDKPGRAGYLYDVFYKGEILCTSHDPEFAACRSLVERGLTGELKVWRVGKPYHDMRISNIENGARMATIENATKGPRFGRYKPREIVETVASGQVKQPCPA